VKRALLAALLALGCSRTPRGRGGEAPARTPAQPLVVIDAAPAIPEAAAIAWKNPERGRFDPPHVHLESSLGELYIWTGTRPDGPATLERLPSPGPAKWKIEVPRDFVPAAALAADDERVFLVHHSLIGSGAEAMAFAAADGRLLWRTPLRGLGPVAHSEYENHTAVELLPGAAIVIFGSESAGRYIEVLDLRGNLRSTHILPDR